MSGPAADPRAVAARALMRCEQAGYANLVLDAELKKLPAGALAGRDRAFAGAIFYTVLEHLATLDYILAQFLPKGLARLDPEVRAVLRSALAQARYMQVPAAAAVNEAVRLTRALRKASAAGLVNAVLRRAAGYDLAGAVFADECQRVMVLGSCSAQVARFLLQYYPDEALDILTAKPEGGATAIRANPCKTSAQQLAQLLAAPQPAGGPIARAVRPGCVPGSLLAGFAGSPADNEYFRAGYYHVQGQASQLAALALGAQPGDTVADLCAAPGGKTMTIAGQMQGKGRLYSCDVSDNRVSLIRKAVQRMGFGHVQVLRSDATRPSPALAGVGRILADVPCSGLGILAKKPDIRYKTLDPGQHSQLLATQAAILDSAAQSLAPGGRLVYSTCTIDPRENQRQVQQFLQRQRGFAMAMPQRFFPPGMQIDEYGALSLPNRTGMDGFFIAVMEKRAPK